MATTVDEMDAAVAVVLSHHSEVTTPEQAPPQLLCPLNTTIVPQINHSLNVLLFILYPGPIFHLAAFFRA